jgi:deoxyadenosine/deoxycytidine kinase
MQHISDNLYFQLSIKINTAKNKEYLDDLHLVYNSFNNSDDGIEKISYSMSSVIYKFFPNEVATETAAQVDEMRKRGYILH